MTPLSTSQPGSPPTSLRAGLRAAIEVLAGGGCVAFPSETVWGLAACARSSAAVAGLGRWKGRAEEQPISVLVSGPAVLADFGFDPDPRARRLMDRFWPGPLTLVLPCRSPFAPGIGREDGSVGVRCSSHPVAAEFIRAVEAAGLGPVTATSCNRSGDLPPRSEEEVRALCAAGEDGPYVLAAGAEHPPPGQPTTVLDLVGESPRILREGGIDAASLQIFFDVGEDGPGASPEASPPGDLRR